MWTACRLTDRRAIERFLQRDRPYGAYALGDLEPELFAQTEWAGAYRQDELGSLVLHYKGLREPALVLVGKPAGVDAILKRILRPERVYLTCKAEHRAVAAASYSWQALIPMWRMALDTENWEPGNENCTPLTRADVQQMQELYALGPTNAFDPSQIDGGAFYGLRVEGELVSVAGTHLVSPTYGVAAVGNVFTHPAHRGHGYATATTHAVVGELGRRHVPTIVLNVRQSNRAAISVYEKLGFQRHCPYLEGVAVAV